MLKRRFISLMQRIGAKGNVGRRWNELEKLYAEKHRAYHTLAHISNCLKEFDQVKNLVENADAMEMAIFYHDAMYVPGMKDNEKKSAELAERFLKNLGVEKIFRTAATNLILSTAFLSSLETPDEKFLHDIDYSILGEKEEVFAEYESGVRREFSRLGTEEYKKGRRAFLEALLARPSIFLTDFFNEKYEKKAGKNIKKLLKKISA